jgi:uncharacterized membrane protein
MKFTLRTLPITILCVSMACGAVLAQVQPPPSGPVHSRLGFAMAGRKAQSTAAANHQAESPGSRDISFAFGMVDFPGQMATIATGVNDKGEIVGVCGPAFDSGFLLKDGRFTAIAYPGAAYSFPYEINDAGVIVGIYGASPGDGHGFKLTGKTYTTIDYPGATYTSAQAINKSGEIVGAWADSDEISHGFLLSKGVFTRFDVPGAASTEAYGINKAGEIVGDYGDSSGNTHGFLLQSGTFTTINYPGGYSQNYLGGINDSGVIVGAYGNPTTINGVAYSWEHSFIYESGQFTNADAPFGPPAATETFQISNNGVIVGEYVDDSGTVYGYEAVVGP